MRNYLVAMGIRTACLPLAVWAYFAEQYALAWVAALGATFIPSFAVMLANAVDRRQRPSEATIASPVRGLGPGRQPDGTGTGTGTEAGPAGRDAARDDGTPIPGTVVSSRDTAYPASGADGDRPEDSP